ncbi:universal stress protein [Haloechinothrix halophila]|uniref:universal stress protein n=1 Tax=Haloechinothrix halophila TaxID=1069073 RepID=UPI00040A7288|nr:universal stress protein [Haloechinothrix halophila]
MSEPQSLPQDAVLVGFDGSAHSRRAVLWAADEAASSERDLAIVQSYEWSVSMMGDYDDRLRRHASDQVDEVAVEVRANHPELPVHTRIPRGRPDDTIPDIVAESEPRLLVLGASGLGAVSRVVLGSTAGALVRTVHVPIVVVRGEHSAPSTAPVVAGLDGTSAGDRAVEFAFDFAARHGAPVRVVHVVAGTSHLSPGAPSVPVAPREPLDAGQEEAKPSEDAVALRVERLLEGHPVKDVETDVVVGQPAGALMDAAATAQLLVVGTHGRGLLDRIILGSVSRAVLYHAPCPVGLLHPR